VVSVQAEVLLAGPAVSAESLVLTAPISFWGGVDPKSGEIADPRHPQFARQISGRALLVPATVGSSSAAAILLELVHAGKAPAAMVLHEPDAILLLGLIVAREMGMPIPIAVRLDRQHFSHFQNEQITISAGGVIEVVKRG
jgi:predicted aconitase with swiveling domain